MNFQHHYDEIARLRRSQERAIRFLGWFLVAWSLAGMTVLGLAIGCQP